MKKKNKKIEPPVLPDGWYFCRQWINLRRGQYHHEWLPARIQDGRVQLFGSSAFKPFDCPVLENALWSGPIEPPPLDVPPSTSLALEQVGEKFNRHNWMTKPEETGEPGPLAYELARGIVDAFVQTVDSLGDYYREHDEHRIEIVEKIAGLIERVKRTT